MNTLALYSRREIHKLVFYGLLSAPLGCASNEKTTSQKAPHTKLPNYRGPRVAPNEISSDFMWQQRITARHAQSTTSFDAIVQKRKNQLLIVGLTPFNSRAFLIEQNGLQFKFEKFVPFDLPFAPEAILIDIHRCFFHLLVNNLPESGKRAGQWGEENIVDFFKGGALIKRTYLNVSGTGSALVVTYPGGYTPFTPPPITILHNRAYGYQLKIETISSRLL